MLNVAGDLGWLTKVPRIRKPRVRLISADYSYLRTDEEIARLLRAAQEEESEVAYVLYAMAVYTGMNANAEKHVDRDSGRRGKSSLVCDDEERGVVGYSSSRLRHWAEGNAS